MAGRLSCVLRQKPLVCTLLNPNGAAPELKDRRRWAADASLLAMSLCFGRVPVVRIGHPHGVLRRAWQVGMGGANTGSLQGIVASRNRCPWRTGQSGRIAERWQAGRQDSLAWLVSAPTPRPVLGG